MSRREEFLERALEFHDEYRTTAVVLEMMRENKTMGRDWDVAVARQIAALDAWMELPLEYDDVHADD